MKQKVQRSKLPSKCACGTFLVEDLHHFLGCHKLKPTLPIRHRDRLLHLLARLARMGNITTQVEVPLDDLKRPDANFFLSSRTLAIDVSVIHPSAKTYRTAAARPLGAAAIREKSKCNAYEEKSRKEDLAFLPFVMETYGAFGKKASETLAELAAEASHNGLHQIAGMNFTTFAVRALSVCLQSGNAMALLKGSTLSRRAASGIR